MPAATTVFTANDFVLPNVSANVPQTELGAVQQLYAAQYSMAGGNVSVNAGNDILHLTRDAGTENYGGIRPSCWINAIPASGLVLVPDRAVPDELGDA